MRLHRSRWAHRLPQQTRIGLPNIAPEAHDSVALTRYTMSGQRFLLVGEQHGWRWNLDGVERPCMGEIV
jgi:hypothetical protein